MCLKFWPSSVKEHLFCLASNSWAGLVWSQAEPNISIIHPTHSQTAREVGGVYRTEMVSALGKHTGGRRLTKHKRAHFPACSSPTMMRRAAGHTWKDSKMKSRLTFCCSGHQSAVQSAAPESRARRQQSTTAAGPSWRRTLFLQREETRKSSLLFHQTVV